MLYYWVTAGDWLMTLEEIFKHPRGSAAVLTARLLLIDVPKSKRSSCMEVLFTKFGVDNRACWWRAYSPYLLCYNCKTVHKVSVPVTSHLLEDCGLCKDSSILRPRMYGFATDNLAQRFTSIEPVIQELALEYLYLRQEQHHVNTTTESRCD